MFVAIGHDPRSAFLEGQVALNEGGYVVVDQPSTKTNLPVCLCLRRRSMTTTSRLLPQQAPAAAQPSMLNISSQKAVKHSRAT